MDLEKRKELSSYLRWGDLTKIAKLAGVTRKTVENWLNGTVNKSTASSYIIALARKRKEEIEQLIATEMSA